MQTSSPSSATHSTPITTKAKQPNKKDVVYKCLEADRIYVLMQKDYRLSRNARAKWYLSHLHGEIKVKKYESCADFTAHELDAVGIVPRAPPPEWDWDVGHLYSYAVTPRTAVRFLAQRYKFVFMLDLSPSASASDLISKGVTSCALLPALRKSLAGLVRPFNVPGSQLLLKPDIYVSVIAWTPFLSETCQAVLHQGWLLTPDNLNSFMRQVVSGLHELELRSSHITAEVHGEMQTIRAESERIFRGLFDEPCGNTPEPGTITTTADSGFVSMMRTGLLGIQLLPPNSAAGIVVVTDGVVSIPDINALDNVLNLFRTKMVSLSFLQVSSIYHPQSSLTRVPYEELMEFASLSTYGAYLPEVPELDTNDFEYNMNIYHDALLVWSFRKALQAIHLPNAMSYYEHFQSTKQSDHAGWYTRGRFSGIKNGYFLNTNEERITKKKIEREAQCSLSSLLSCRLREGYTINEVNFSHDNTRIIIKLTLPWKISSFIHYVIYSDWPLTPKQAPCKIEVYLEGEYDTLHDIVCQRERQYPSHDRNAVIRKFYVMLQHLSYVDQLLAHLESFARNKAHYTLPESVSNGVPLFHIPINSPNTKPELSHEDIAHLHQQFTIFWTPVCSLDVNIWQRWLHSHKIHIILNHDSPLPKNILMPNASGRYGVVQSRKASLQLSEALKRWSSFVLLDNCTFITFIKTADGNSDSPPMSFMIIRITLKPPCVVIWVAFPGGTPGATRHNLLNDLKVKIKTLVVKQHSSFFKQGDPSLEWSEMEACILVEKPLERILIRYNEMPRDILHLLEPAYKTISHQQNASWNGSCFNIDHRSNDVVGNSSNPNVTSNASNGGPAAMAFLSLSRYLHHRRWIWSVQACPTVPLSSSAVTRILNTVTRQRLLQGFHFAHSSQGIHNMARELRLQTGTGGISDQSTLQHCIVQYVVFPPYTATTSPLDTSCSSNSSSEDEQEDTAAEDNELKVITEIWVEPQDGIIDDLSEDWPQVGGYRFHDIPKIVYENDFDIISTLSTFEHLYLLSQTPNTANSPLNLKLGHQENNKQLGPSSSNVIQMPFQWNLKSLLEKSHPTEIFFASFIQNVARYQSDESDTPNELLYDHFKEHIAKLHDREISLSGRDHEVIHEHFQTSPDMEGSKLRYPEIPIEPLPPHSRVSSRFTSGTSMTSSVATADTDVRSVTSSLRSMHQNQDTGRKWICFIKGLSGSHFLLTILPRTFKDLKLLLVNEAAINGQNPLAVQIVKTPIPKLRQPQLFTPEDSLASSMVSLSIDESRKRSMSGSMDLRDKLTSASSRARRAAMKTRDFSSPVTTMADGIRSRTMSIDVSALAAAERNRCKTMESSNLSRGGITGSGTSKHLSTRVRTQTHSHVTKTHKSPLTPPIPLMPRNGPVDSSAVKMVLQEASPVKVRDVWGSLTLPVYVFDCNVSNIVHTLLTTGQAEEQTRTGLTVDVRPESKKLETQDPYLTVTPGKDPLARMEKVLRLHCINLQMSYFKSFVTVLFRSLQLRMPTHSFDVQSAIDYCENESALETDMTEFMLKVCSHVRQVDVDPARPKSHNIVAEQNKIKENDSEDETMFTNSKSMVPVSSLSDAKPCSHIFTNHNVIKKKFCDIQRTSFRAVPEVDNLYFYCPSGEYFFNVPQKHPRDTDDHLGDLDIDEKLKMFSRDNQEMDGSMKEAGSLSLLSSAAASDDQSDLNESESSEQTPPLFLQFSVTIRQGREIYETVEMSELPSCIIDLVQKRSSSSDSTGRMAALDLSKLSVSLDLVTITLPREMTLPLKLESSRRSVSLGSSLSLPEAETSVFFESIIRDDVESSEEKLPPIQAEAVNSLIKALKWMLDDEIAFALTQANPITQTVLSKVASHIDSSKDKPGCVLQQIPLQFVFGADRSLAVFMEFFQNLSIPGYILKQAGKYFYLMQKPKNVEKQVENNDFENQSTFQSQLIGVKEEDLDSSDHSSQISYTWRSDPCEDRKRDCPTFWLILKVFSDMVSVYFQYREGQFDSVLPWRQAQQLLTTEIKALCKRVNQKLLLEDLYETRNCNRLLETETSEEAWPESRSSMRQTSVQEGNEMYEVTFLEANLNERFKPGSFSCSPPIWQTCFPLHSRVKQSQGAPIRCSIALQSLKNVLSSFAVSNRSNMFVYKDEGGNIFYIKIFEIISGCQPRKISGLPPKSDIDDPMSGVKSRSSSICSWNGPDLLESSSDDRVELKVYGISPAGTQITTDLVELLERKLNDKVLEIVSTMLQRNPMCKLAPEDVRFIQKAGSQPTTVLRFSLHSRFRGLKIVHSLLFYFMQNIVRQSYIVPKYSSNASSHQFQDTNAEGFMEASTNVFLYNSTPSMLHKFGKTVGGHRAIACVAMSVRENKDSSGVDSCSNDGDTLWIALEEFAELVKVSLLPEDCKMEEMSPLILQFNIWEQGKVDLSVLRKQIENVASQSLWDLVTELYVMPNDLADNKTSKLSTLFSHFLPAWLSYGLTLSQATVQSETVKFFTKNSALQIVKELKNRVMAAIQDTATEVFQKRIGDDNSFEYVKCSFYNVGSGDPKMSNEFLLIGRNFRHWQACLHHEKSKPEDLNPNNLRSLQLFQPYMKNSVEYQKGRTHSIGSKSIDSEDVGFSTNPSQIDSDSDFIPRQRILVALVSRKGIEVLTYNHSSESLSRLSKHMSMLGQWFSARSSLGSSILAHKLGLTQHPKFFRPSSSTDNNFMSTNQHVETLVKNYAPPQSVPRAVTSSPPQKPSHRMFKEGSFLSVFTDMKLQRPLQKCAYSIERDVTGRHGRQMLELMVSEEKDKGRKHQSVFKMRLVHFCLTPLLFMPRWRQVAHSTRTRKYCADPTLSQVQSQDPIIKSESPKLLRRTAVDERQHTILVQNYLQDYMQYLQTLGFMVIQSRSESSRRPTAPPTGGAFFKKELKRNSQSGRIEDVFLQKTFPAGILNVHIGICEPFVFTKLYALQTNKAQPTQASGRIVQQISSLVEECDRIKFLLHAHSFTYDFHLRVVHSFVAGRPILRKGYNMVAFIEDFLKYYNKGPNFARDALATGVLTLSIGQSVNSTQLYNYILSHEKVYDFKVLRMEPLFVENEGGQFKCDYVLARQSQFKLCSISSERRDSADFDTTVIIGQVEDPSSQLMKLKYFLILTSKREIYPTIGNDKNQGQFKSVLCDLSGVEPTATPPRSTNSEEKDPDSTEMATEVTETEVDLAIGESEDQDHTHFLPDLFKPSAGEPNIRTESVHYVGYFSNHEQSMQKVVCMQTTSVETALASVFGRAIGHCRRDHLWNRMHSNSPTLSFAEFNELLGLTQVYPLSLLELTDRGQAWLEKFQKLLSLKYDSLHRRYASASHDYNVLLRENNVDVCTLTTMSGVQKTCSISIVLREATSDHSVEKHVALVEQTTEAMLADAAYQLWIESF